MKLRNFITGVKRWVGKDCTLKKVILMEATGDQI